MDVIQHIPNVLNNPVLVMESKNYASRITLFGNLMGNGNNKPVLVVLELNPSRHGGLVDEICVVSAYGKDSAQGLIDKSRILYVNEDKKMTNNWLEGTGLQLPFATSQYGYVSTITYKNKNGNRKNSENWTD